MLIGKKLTKILFIYLTILFLFSFCITDSANARGGCFAGGTAILTDQGNKPIETLEKGNSVMGYNFMTHQLELGQIEDIQVISSPEYLLINKITKVTKNHPFYLQTATGFKLELAQKLKIGDKLIGEGESGVIISNIDHFKENITVYNLISVNPNHNFYANGILVHNKGGGGGGGGGSGSLRGGSGGGYYQVTPINSKTLPKYILTLIALVGFMLPTVFWREIYNLIRFSGKEFTNDSDLSDFVKSINSNFTNHYALRYAKDNECWNLIAIQSEINEQEYQQIVSKNQLIEQITYLFNQYQRDWMMQEFEHMLDYVTEPFYSYQYAVLKNDFGTVSDIVYQPQIIEAAPISFKNEGEGHIFRVQVNAKMTNFVISPEGYVLSGEPFNRSFSEYWDISVTSSGKWYLVNIRSQIQ